MKPRQDVEKRVGQDREEEEEEEQEKEWREGSEV